MIKNQDDLAANMAIYAQLTNDYVSSTKDFKEHLDALTRLWGDEINMTSKEKTRELKPFLEETIPVMEERKNEWYM